jgi:hypothetical protein
MDSPLLCCLLVAFVNSREDVPPAVSGADLHRRTISPTSQFAANYACVSPRSQKNGTPSGGGRRTARKTCLLRRRWNTDRWLLGGEL